MVRRSGQLERTVGQGARRSSLGPRGRGIFERLLSAVQPAAKSPRREAFTLAFASGKGGTGKSFLATSLAVLLHARGRGVTIVDCDFGLACDHLLLGVKPDITLQQVVANRGLKLNHRDGQVCWEWESS